MASSSPEGDGVKALGASDTTRSHATRPLSLHALASEIGATLIGDGDLVIDGARAPLHAKAGDLTFAAHAKQRRQLRNTGAGAVLLSMDDAAETAHELPCAVLAHDDPHFALVAALKALFVTPPLDSVVDERAAVAPGAVLGIDVAIGAFAVVGNATLGDRVRVLPFSFIDDDVKIGDDVTVGVGSVLMRGTEIGARTILQPGVVLGADGFGYAPQGTANIKVPQVGGVEIGADVEVGANTCIDRGGLSNTHVGRGTKIDNLVQLGHGVVVGEDAVVIAQVGIGGDSVVGDRALLAGQVGVAHHVAIGADARVGAQGGVTRDVSSQGAVSGYPAFAHGDWLRSMIRVRQLDGMAKRLEETETALAQMQEEIKRLRRHSDSTVIAANPLSDADE